VRDATPRTFVFWVHASTQARFEQAYRGLADRLELPGRNDSNADVLRLVSNWLCDESNGPWMMIVDNVDDVNTFFASRRCNQDGSVGSSATSLAAYLPQSRNGLILITSRSRDAAARLTGGYHNIKEVLVMDKSQGLQLLHHKLSAATLNDQEGAIQLVRTLDYMPLAITQAAAYINRRAHMTIAGYLSEFRANDKRRASLLHQDAGDLRRDQSASNSVVTTWQMAFERVQRERPSAAELLSLMSFFNPQGIPEKTLRRYNKATANVGALDNEGETDHTFHEDFDILHAYSLITATTMTTAANHKMWEMHPLVQFCTRVWLSSNGKAEWWNGAFIELLAQEFPSGAYEYWAQCQQLLPHVELLYNTEPASEEPLKAWTQVLTNAAWYLYTKGSYHTAQVVASKAVTARERVLGFDNNQTLTSVTVLAIVLHCLKNYEEAEKLHRRVLEGREKELGAHHPDTLMSISCLGQVLQSQKRYKEAETLHRRALKGCEKELGVYHRATLMSVSSLSIALQSQGNYEEVEKLNQRAHKGFEKELGVHHPFTLKSVKDLAEVLWYKRKYEEAEKLYKQVLEVREKVLGVHHPNTLISVSDLARVLSDQGKYKEAEKLYKQVLEVREKVQGVHHPDTLISVSDLATVLSDQGKYKEAEKLFQRALEGYEKELGAYHSRTLESIDSFARFLNVSKRHEEAAEMYQRAYEVRVKNLGSQHPETLEWEEQVLWMQQNALVNKQPSLHDEEVGGNTACAESVVVCKQTDKQDSFLTRIKARMHRRDK
jgi:tetratricopeptide (TPR) repeat protein